MFQEQFHYNDQENELPYKVRSVRPVTNYTRRKAQKICFHLSCLCCKEKFNLTTSKEHWVKEGALKMSFVRCRCQPTRVEPTGGNAAVQEPGSEMEVENDQVATVQEPGSEMEVSRVEIIQAATVQEPGVSRAEINQATVQEPGVSRAEIIQAADVVEPIVSRAEIIQAADVVEPIVELENIVAEINQAADVDEPVVETGSGVVIGTEIDARIAALEKRVAVAEKAVSIAVASETYVKEISEALVIDAETKAAAAATKMEQEVQKAKSKKEAAVRRATTFVTQAEVKAAIAVRDAKASEQRALTRATEAEAAVVRAEAAEAIALARAQTAENRITEAEAEVAAVIRRYGVECATCQDALFRNAAHQDVAVTVCGHAFHMDCMDDLVRSRAPLVCPNCRNSLRFLVYGLNSFYHRTKSNFTL